MQIRNRRLAGMTRLLVEDKSPEMFAREVGVSLRTVHEALIGDDRRERALDRMFLNLLAIPHYRSCVALYGSMEMLGADLYVVAEHPEEAERWTKT